MTSSQVKDAWAVRLADEQSEGLQVGVLLRIISLLGRSANRHSPWKAAQAMGFLLTKSTFTSILHAGNA